ncbi:hypothetical protein MMC11_004922 [Xylographa trunciseda]|nr:hypothetical protein [Xylographa trunciseda]
MRYLIPLALGLSSIATAFDSSLHVYERDTPASPDNHLHQHYARNLDIQNYALYPRAVDPQRYHKLHDQAEASFAQKQYADALNYANRELALRKTADEERGSDAGHVHYTQVTLPAFIRKIRYTIAATKAAEVAAAKAKKKQAAEIIKNNPPFQGWGKHKTTRRALEAFWEGLEERDAAADPGDGYELYMLD